MPIKKVFVKFAEIIISKRNAVIPVGYDRWYLIIHYDGFPGKPSGIAERQITSDGAKFVHIRKDEGASAKHRISDDLYATGNGGNLKGEALNDAIVNIISFAGAPGLAMSLTYNYVIKPGARGIAKLEFFLRSYIPDLIKRSNGIY